MRKQTTLLATIGLVLTMSLGAAACGETNHSESSGENSSQSSSGGGSSWISSDWTEMPENTNKNLKYFGYFHSDGFGQKQSSYVNEIAALGNANMAMINSAFTVDEVKKDLTDVKNGGMKAILSIHGLFNGGATGKLDTAHLKSDYQAVWTAYQSEIQSFIDDGTIYAFYFDEPRWNGIGEEDFRTLTSYLRETVPTVGTMACMTAMDIGIGNYGGVGECSEKYMEYCTDVMFDSYADWNDETRREYLGKLKAKANDDAWIWGCPKGFEAEPEVNDVKKMVDHIKGQYTEAIQDERYAGIISFSYASGTEEGDWGYGLADFFDDQNDYYSKELKDLYIEIGCAVTGKTPPEREDVNFVVKEPTETYALGDSVPLPEATATGGSGAVYTVTASVTAPDGSAVTVANDAFKAEQAGRYEAVFTVEAGTQTLEKKVGVYVKSALEISTFESAAFAGDVTGSGDDVWCWPREVTVDFGRGDSRGSLKVTPHATDGTWPNVYFKYQGKEEIDMTGLGGVSMWLYNPSDEEITSFAVKVNNGQSVQEATKKIALPSKVWTEFSITVAEMKALSPDLDLTKVHVAVTNSGSSYTNRTTFYIDDVYLTEVEPVIEDANALTFENSAYLAAVSQDNDSKWCWPCALSDERAHGGSYSLKVTPHQTDGTWPVIVFKLGGGDTFDMTNYDEVSLWIYNPSDTVIESFGIAATDAAAKKAECVANLPAGEWTKLSIGKAALTAAGADVTKLTLKFGNHASGYVNRTPFYVDDVCLTGQPAPAAAPEINFENAADTSLLVQDDDSKWAWTCEISSEQAHGGASSLKVNVRQDSGKWPVIVFKLGGGDTFDMTDYDEVSLWVYNPSDTVIESFGITAVDGAGKKVDFTANLPAGEWTKLSIGKAALVEAGLDITSLKLRFGNYASDYLNRTAFYVDDIKLS